MPDSPTHDRSPGDWSAAFAALPLETAPAGGWQRVAQRLHANASRHRAARRERRLTWLVATAGAAVLVVAAWAPLSRWERSGTQPRTAAVDGVPETRRPAAPVGAAASTAPSMAKAGRPAVSDADASRAADTRPEAASTSRRRSGDARPDRIAASDSRPTPGVSPAVSSPAPGQPDAPSTALLSASPTDRDEVERMRQLQGRSAQLEALVALVRDDRVGSAGGELLTAELDARIAGVDAALTQADLDAGRKSALWQQRVELLQQLAGVESTARWLASQGSLYDAALVSVD